MDGAHAPADGSIRVAAAFVETRAERKEHGHVESDSIHAVRLGEDFHIRVKDSGDRPGPIKLRYSQQIISAIFSASMILFIVASY